MNCHVFEDMLHAYLDGRLKRMPRSAMRHRRTCTKCSELAREMTTMVKACRSMDAPALQARGKAQLAARIRRNLYRREQGTGTAAERSSWREIYAGIRWRRVIPAGVAMAAAIYWLVAIGLKPEAPPQQQASAVEFEELLDEHATLIDQTIFYQAYPSFSPMAMTVSATPGGAQRQR